MHEGKDSPLPLAGTAKPTEPLSLEAQPKSDASTAVDFSPISGTDSEDSGHESSSSSEDGLEVIRKDLLNQKQVTSSSSPSESKYLAGFMRSPDKSQPNLQA